MVSAVGAFIFTNTQIQGLCQFLDGDVMHQTVAHVSLKFWKLRAMQGKGPCVS